MKQQMLNLMQAMGFFAPFRLANRGRALIVTYHRFTHSNTDIKTAARAFAEQLDYLTRYYQVVPLSFIAERLTNQQRLPADIAAITLDDGVREHHVIHVPL